MSSELNPLQQNIAGKNSGNSPHSSDGEFEDPSSISRVQSSVSAIISKGPIVIPKMHAKVKTPRYAKGTLSSKGLTDEQKTAIIGNTTTTIRGSKKPNKRSSSISLNNARTSSTTHKTYTTAKSRLNLSPRKKNKEATSSQSGRNRAFSSAKPLQSARGNRSSKDSSMSKKEFEDKKITLREQFTIWQIEMNLKIEEAERKQKEQQEEQVKQTKAELETSLQKETSERQKLEASLQQAVGTTADLQREVALLKELVQRYLNQSVTAKVEEKEPVLESPRKRPQRKPSAPPTKEPTSTVIVEQKEEKTETPPQSDAPYRKVIQTTLKTEEQTLFSQSLLEALPKEVTRYKYQMTNYEILKDFSVQYLPEDCQALQKLQSQGNLKDSQLPLKVPKPLAESLILLCQSPDFVSPEEEKYLNLLDSLELPENPENKTQTLMNFYREHHLEMGVLAAKQYFVSGVKKTWIAEQSKYAKSLVELLKYPELLFIKQTIEQYLSPAMRGFQSYTSFNKDCALALSNFALNSTEQQTFKDAPQQCLSNFISHIENTIVKPFEKLLRADLLRSFEDFFKGIQGEEDAKIKESYKGKIKELRIYKEKFWLDLSKFYEDKLAKYCISLEALNHSFKIPFSLERVSIESESSPSASVLSQIQTCEAAFHVSQLLCYFARILEISPQDLLRNTTDGTTLSIKNLNLTNCEIDYIPNAVLKSKRLTHVQSIVLDGNPLRIFPGFEHAKQLVLLSLKNTKITDIPPVFNDPKISMGDRYFPELRIIRLDGSRIETMPESMYTSTPQLVISCIKTPFATNKVPSPRQPNFLIIKTQDILEIYNAYTVVVFTREDDTGIVDSRQQTILESITPSQEKKH